MSRWSKIGDARMSVEKTASEVVQGGRLRVWKMLVKERRGGLLTGRDRRGLCGLGLVEVRVGSLWFFGGRGSDRRGWDVF